MSNSQKPRRHASLAARSHSSPRELHDARHGTHDEHQPERYAIDAHGPDDSLRSAWSKRHGTAAADDRLWREPYACGEVKQYSHGYWHVPRVSDGSATPTENPQKSAKREKKSLCTGSDKLYYVN